MLEGLNGSPGPAESYVIDSPGMSTKAAPPARLPSEPKRGQTTIGSRHVGTRDAGVAIDPGELSVGDAELAVPAAAGVLELLVPGAEGEGARAEEEEPLQAATTSATARTVALICGLNAGLWHQLRLRQGIPVSLATAGGSETTKFGRSAPRCVAGSIIAAAVMSALQVSPATTDFLSLLSPAARELLSSTSRRVDYPAGSILYRPGEGERVLIVNRGIVRIYFQDAEGRQATVLFGHPGSMLGVVNVLGEIPDLFAQAVVRASAIQIDHRVLRDLINRDLSTSNVVAAYLATRLRRTMELVGLRTIGSIRERLAYDLLDRASRVQLETGRLIVEATQAELADSIGTSREVAARELAVLRSEGMITTVRGMVRIESPIRLANIVRDFGI